MEPIFYLQGLLVLLNADVGLEARQPWSDSIAARTPDRMRGGELLLHMPRPIWGIHDRHCGYYADGLTSESGFIHNLQIVVILGRWIFLIFIWTEEGIYTQGETQVDFQSIWIETQSIPYKSCNLILLALNLQFLILYIQL